MKRLAILLLLVTTHAATAQNNVCVPVATGVPTREGPPKWLDWSGSGPIAADQALDDPRWLGATGHTFERGSAKAPLQTRALYANQGGQEYLYLSFIIDIDAFDDRPGHETVMRKRDVFLGFRRPTQAGTEKGYIFQFHLTGSGSGVSRPTPCDADNACSEDVIPEAMWHDYWRVFVDHGNTNTEGCSGTNEIGRQYTPLPAASVPWMTGATPDADAVRYWKVASSDPTPLLQNRWAVQVRIPMIAPVAAGTSPVGTGIERGSTFFYEATAALDRQSVTDPLIDVGEFARIGWFPPTLNNTVCPGTDVLIHPEPADLAVLTTSAPPAIPCDGGLTIDRDHVGVLFNAPIPTDPTAFQAFRPDRQFKAHDATTPNHVIALPVNDSASTITAPIQARFRLAGWGSAPWSSTTDTGTWEDIRGAKNGVCAAGTSPACTPVPIEPHKQGLITFDWTIGADTAGIGSSEYCKFGLMPPPGETCSSGCSCDNLTPETTCAAATGVRASKAGGGFWPCVPSIYKFDQCMLVELNAPNGSATFEHQSIWNNMSFGEMSVLAHEALIDARQLPKAPGQKVQDIFFIAMPRNMPASVPPTTTSVQLAQNAALAAATRIAQPYINDLQRVPKEQLAAIVKRLDRPAIDIRIPENDERIRQILAARRIMPAADAARVGALIQIAVNQGRGDKPSAALVQDTVKSVGSSTAAEIVPTLEIYPFYRPLGKGREYQPMTSFSVFLSHEQTLSGIRYVIDGADKVGENVYHMRIPVGFAKKIQVRAQALVGNEAALPPGMPKWPCAGGCVACGGGANRSCGLVTMLGNATPGLIAGVFVVRRRRKKTEKKPTKTAEPTKGPTQATPAS